jgi:hypothetical protein
MNGKKGELQVGEGNRWLSRLEPRMTQRSRIVYGLTVGWTQRSRIGRHCHIGHIQMVQFSKQSGPAIHLRFQD